jgi:hypothetical protein
MVVFHRTDTRLPYLLENFQLGVHRCARHLFAYLLKVEKYKRSFLYYYMIQDSIKYLLTCYLSPASLLYVTISFLVHIIMLHFYFDIYL